MATNQERTPQQKKSFARTGFDAGESTGEAGTRKGDTSQVGKTHPQPSAPSGANKDVWEQASLTASNGGGFSGLNEEGRRTATQAEYDKMVESDKEVKKWAGNDPKILGDVGQKESK